MAGLSKSEVLARIQQDGVVPILRTPTADDALELADVLRLSRMHSLEIPLTVPGALDVIAELSISFSPELAVGAGSVLSIQEAMAAQEAGATFIVTPVFDGAIIAYCRANGLACFPGALSPTEILTAWSAGADCVKVFPVSAMGGPEYIRALKAPLPQVNMMPTGGVTVQNAAGFIAAGAFALGVGGELTDVAAMRAGKRDLVRERAELFLEIVEDARRTRLQSLPEAHLTAGASN